MLSRSVVLLCHNLQVSSTETSPAKRPLVLAIFLIVAGAVGLYAAFALTLDKFQMLEHPATHLTCDFSVLVQCGENLASAQGAVLGFPNPIIGLVCWPLVICVGVALLAGVRFPRWFLALFNLGVVLAIVLVIFLIITSIYFLGTLCPWCMITWTATIPTFWAVSLYNLKSGNIPIPASARKVAGVLYGWVPVITLVSYAVVAVLAQVRLDWLHHI